MKRSMLILIPALLMTVTSLTQAGDRRHHHGGDRFYDYAPVTDVRPIYHTSRRQVPEQHCWVETVRIEAQHRSHTAPIVGGLVGAAIGNRLGHSKRNKQVGAVAGAILGASIGNDIRNRRGDRHGPRYEDVERCETRYRVDAVEELVGYDVSYRYRGQLYHTRTDRHPGKRIKLAVAVRPVD